MKIVLIMLFCLTTAMSHSSQQSDKRKQSNVDGDILELYSWPGSASGEWNFSILYNTSRQKSVSDVFNKRITLEGVNRLKEEISKLEPGSKITWLGELTTWDGHKQKGTEKLAYPPDAIVREVKEFASAKKIEIAGPFKQSAR